MPSPGRDERAYVKGAYADRDTNPDEETTVFNKRWQQRIEKNPELAGPRYCTRCDVKLSRWNMMTLCFPCEREERLDNEERLDATG